MSSRFAVVAILLGLFGCGSNESEAADAEGGAFRGGDVLPELSLWGYLRHDTTGLATDAVLGPLTFDSIRQSTDKTHALIHVSGFT